MLEQIQEIVKKNLPAEVGDQLKRHLQEAEATSRRLQAVDAELQVKCKALEACQAHVVDLEAKLKTAGDLEKREKDVTHREIVLSVTLADQRAAAAEGRAQAVYDLASLAFRNPRIIRSSQESEVIPIVPTGQSYASGTANKSKTVTETQESQ